MNAVFLGGGSLRLLPIFRGIFAKAPEYFRNGEIRLVDLKVERAEAVGKLILACPEYETVGCKVVWTDKLEEVLPGTDVLYLTMAARSNPTDTQSFFLSNRYGLHSSDNLSVSGAFLSLRLGRIIFDIAKKMEKFCPDALMLIFPNPIAVYSHLVNTHTKIKALGICGGFNNHRFDLTRMTGRDEYDSGWNLIAAGVNHLSYVLRGDYRGADLYSEVLPKYLNDSWKPIECDSPWDWARDAMRHAQELFYKMYKKYGVIIFSSEGDGSAHIDLENAVKFQISRFGTGEGFDPVKEGIIFRENTAKAFAKVIEDSKHPEKIDWSAPGGNYGKNELDISIPIFRALAGTEPMRIVATRPNYGAVRGFDDGMPLEYSMDICGKTVTPVEDLYIPDPFFGLTAALADFQRLQSEAIAAWDPEIFALALESYPLHQFTESRRNYFREMFDLYSDIDPHMLAAKNFV